MWISPWCASQVIQKLWPSVSDWFQRKLKANSSVLYLCASMGLAKPEAELEPELKKQLLDIVEFEDWV